MSCVVYLSGEITGDPDYKGKFQAAAARLSRNGWFTVLNPAVLPKGLKEADYMRIAFAMIEAANGVILLPSWEESPGARLEKAYAERIGIPCKEYTEIMEGQDVL